MVIVLGIIIFLIIMFLYAYLYEPFQLVVKEVDISNKVGARIVQITDIHYGDSFNTKMLAKVVDKVNSIDKDIVIFSGDLFVDGYAGEVESLTNELKRIKCDYKYAVWGNHDYKEFAIQHFDSVLKNAGFTVLKDESKLIEINNKIIHIVGTDDFRAGNPDYDLIHNFNKDVDSDFNLMISHVPDIAPEFVNDNYDLIMSGHTHGGQIRPIGNLGWRTSYGRVYINDLYELDNDTKLYVSTGLGTTSVRVRFRTKPCIDILNI